MTREWSEGNAGKARQQPEGVSLEQQERVREAREGALEARASRPAGQKRGALEENRRLRDTMRKNILQSRK